MEREKLAQIIFANNVDLDRPLFFKEQIKRAFQAADAFLEEQKNSKSALHSSIESNFLDLVAKFVNNHKKIHAIKELRRATGLGLKEAKDEVESFEQLRKWKQAVNFTLIDPTYASYAISYYETNGIDATMHFPYN